MANVGLRPVNMKFTFDWCVFAYPDNGDHTDANLQCSDICSGQDNQAKSALVDRLLQTNATLQYQYCEDGDGAFNKTADACIQCLNKVPNAKALANCTNRRIKSNIPAPITDWCHRRQRVKHRLRSATETW